LARASLAVSVCMMNSSTIKRTPIGTISQGRIEQQAC
jgi:hypothetical protein